MTKQRSPAETYLQAVRRQLEAGEEELTAVFGTRRSAPPSCWRSATRPGWPRPAGEGGGCWRR